MMKQLELALSIRNAFNLTFKIDKQFIFFQMSITFESYKVKSFLLECLQHMNDLHESNINGSM